MFYEYLIYYIIVCIAYGISSTVYIVPKYANVVKYQLETETIFDEFNIFTRFGMKVLIAIFYTIVAPISIYYHMKNPMIYKWALISALIDDEKVRDELWNDILEEIETEYE